MACGSLSPGHRAVSCIECAAIYARRRNEARRKGPICGADASHRADRCSDCSRLRAATRERRRSPLCGSNNREHQSSDCALCARLYRTRWKTRHRDTISAKRARARAQRPADVAASLDHEAKIRSRIHAAAKRAAIGNLCFACERTGKLVFLEVDEGLQVYLFRCKQHAGAGAKILADAQAAEYGADVAFPPSAHRHAAGKRGRPKRIRPTLPAIERVASVREGSIGEKYAAAIELADRIPRSDLDAIRTAAHVDNFLGRRREVPDWSPAYHVNFARLVFEYFEKRVDVETQ